MRPDQESDDGQAARNQRVQGADNKGSGKSPEDHGQITRMPDETIGTAVNNPVSPVFLDAHGCLKKPVNDYRPRAEGDT